MEEEKFLFVVKEAECGFMAAFTNDTGTAFGGGGTTKNEAISKATLMLISGLDLPKTRDSSLPLDVAEGVP